MGPYFLFFILENGNLLIWFGHIYKNQIKTLHMRKIYKFIKFIVKYNKNTIYGNELLIV